MNKTRLLLGRCLRILFVMVLVLPLMAATPVLAPADLHAQPILLEMARSQPEEMVSVIVQKAGKDTRVEDLVTRLGGSVTQDLRIINAFAARLPAKAVPQLAQAEGVRWVSLDAPTVSTGLLEALAGTPAANEFQPTGTLINLTNGLGGNDSTTPRVAVDGSGVIHAVFQAKTGSKIDIFYANNRGGVWSAPVNLTNQLASKDALAPDVAVDVRGLVHMVFQGQKGSKKDIFYTDNQSGAFSEPVNLTNQLGGNDALSPAIAVDASGAAHVVFQGLKDTVTKKKDIFYINNRGGTFGTPLNVTNQLGRNDSLMPALAVDSSGAVHVVFQGLTDTLTKKRDIFYTHNRSGSFGAPVKVTNQLGGNDALAPVVAADMSGTAHVVFQGQTGGRKDIFYTSNPSGAFGTLVNVTNGLGNNDSLTPDLAVDGNGAAHVVLQGKIGATRDIFYTHNQGGAFATPVNLSNGLGGKDALAPALAVEKSGVARMVFQGQTSSKQDIYYDQATFSASAANNIILTAGPAQVGDEAAINVTMTLAAAEASAGVAPGTLDVVDTDGQGASALCGSPTPAQQDIAPGQVATFTWTCTAAAGALPSHIAFEAQAAGTSPSATWPRARSNSVFILPVVDPVFVAWATAQGTAVDNTFTDIGKIIDPAGLGPDDVYGSGANVKAALTGFEAQVTPGYVISKVRLALKAYTDMAFDKTVKFQIYIAGDKVAEVEKDGRIFDGVVGAGNAGIVYVDLTDSRAWQWGDFYNGLEVVIDQGSLDRTMLVHYDAIGLRVTGAPGADPSADAMNSSTLAQGPIYTSRLANAFNSAVRAPDVWNEAPAYLQGYRVTVAVVDSGVGNAKALSRRLIKSVNFNQAYHDGSDRFGHGTLVAGLVGGDGLDSSGQYMGIAPKANVLNVRVSDDQGMSHESDVIAALQWVYEHKGLYNIRVVNLSLNSSMAQSYHTSPLDAACEILWLNRVVVVVSAGNNGAATLYPPANDPFVITVGAIDDKGTASLADDAVAAFSAYGVAESGLAKPDLVAPGRNLIAPLPENDKLTLGQAHGPNRVGKDYFRMSGTSVSAPIVSGAAALLLQKEPTLNPDQVKYRLMATANKSWPGYDATKAGAGTLDVYAAVHGATTQAANTGVAVSNLLTTGPDGVLGPSVSWSSVSWSSVSWSSVSWSSVSWSSVSWSSVSWSSDYWEP